MEVILNIKEYTKGSSSSERIVSTHVFTQQYNAAEGFNKEWV
jgi:hypothetical protein